MQGSLFPELGEGKVKKKELVLPPKIRNPFKLEGNARISFSGGRTSGYMLWRLLQEGLTPTTHVLFANTGKEREATLEFVRDVSLHWGIEIHWLEYRKGAKFEEVTFETASRDGEPFEALIRDKQALPNRTMRFCTEELKVIPMRKWMQSQGYPEWTCVVGFRADEPKRVAKITGRPQPEEEDLHLPLYHADVTEFEVLNFWSVQPFDLKLTPGDSNCDLCFLKGAGLRYNLIRNEPQRAEWWLRMQKETGWEWINPLGGRPSYDKLYHLAVSQQQIAFEDEMEPGFDCFCGD